MKLASLILLPHQIYIPRGIYSGVKYRKVTLGQNPTRTKADFDLMRRIRVSVQAE